jgi:7-cyano-7-deazaguanine synthase in queuosine biosynthesis
MSTWDIICRTGPTDAYLPELARTDPRIIVPVDQPGAPGEVVNGLLSRISEYTRRAVPPPAIDLLYLAVAAYTADLRVQRKLAPDRWTRQFKLHQPVSDLTMWLALEPALREMLGFLTGDDWDFALRQREEMVVPLRGAPLAPPSAVSLFSGGLDSFIGASDLLTDGGRVALVSHYGPGVTSSFQRTLFSKFEEQHQGRATHIRFYIHPPLGEAADGEPTMRSRSLLFLALGTAVASSFGQTVPLCVPENGLVSLNTPLIATRMGSLSTRTTHPHFVTLFQQVLRSLGLPIRIDLPYHFQTKGEMLRQARNQPLVTACAQHTMSCAHPEAGRHSGAAPSLHCGYCVPCLIRRAAMDAAGVRDAPYRVDVLQHPPSHDSASGRDLRAFLIAVERLRARPRQATRFHVLDSGPLPPADIARYADVYVRGLEELAQFFSPLTAAI